VPDVRRDDLTAIRPVSLLRLPRSIVWVCHHVRLGRVTPFTVLARHDLDRRRAVRAVPLYVDRPDWKGLQAGAHVSGDIDIHVERPRRPTTSGTPFDRLHGFTEYVQISVGATGVARWVAASVHEQYASQRNVAARMRGAARAGYSQRRRSWCGTRTCGSRGRRGRAW